MRNQTFNAEFTRQFKLGYIEFPWKIEQYYDNFVFRQFSGSRREIPVLGEYFEKEINHSSFIRALIYKMERYDYPDSCLLVNYSQRLVKILSRLEKEEPYCTQYYNRILNILRPFAVFAGAFKEKIHEHLEQLKKSSGVSRPGSGPACSRDITDIIIASEQDAVELKKYYDDFDYLLQQETEQAKGVRVTSRVEQYLSRLITCTERSAVDTESTITAFQKLEEYLSTVEQQEMYN